MSYWINLRATVVLLGATLGVVAKPAEPAVSIKQVGPAALITLKHEGPYWTVGRTFRRVDDFRAARGEPGPMFIRYSADPMGQGSVKLLTEVGFFAKRTDDIEPPFQMAERSAETVASALIAGPPSATTRHYGPMRQWIVTHGYSPLGPIYEIYVGASTAGMSKDQQTEIQMPIHAANKPRPSSAYPQPSTPIRSATEEKPPSGPSTPPQSEEVPTPPPQESPPTAEPSAPPSADSVLTAPPTAVDPVAPPVEAIPKNEPPIQKQKIEDSNPKRLGTDMHSLAAQLEAAAKSPNPPIEPGAPEGSEPTTDRVAPSSSSIAEMFASGRFDGAAELLMPKEATGDIWFGQVVFRVDGVAKGIKQIYPESGENVTGLAGAIASRYRSLNAGAATKPLQQAVVRVDPAADPQAETKQAVIHDLDRLLARLAVRGVDADAATRELIALIERTREIQQQASSAQPAGAARDRTPR